MSVKMPAETPPGTADSFYDEYIRYSQVEEAPIGNEEDAPIEIETYYVGEKGH